VVKVLLDNLIPRFGPVEYIDSHNGSQFTANIIKDKTKELSLTWEYHIPWHPLPQDELRE
jgi:hypothetical protein